MPKTALQLLLILILLETSFCFANSNQETLSLLNKNQQPTDEVLATLLSPGEFPNRRFVYISQGEEAQYCIDSSLSAKDPFAQVYPERVSWPSIGGLSLVVEKLDLRLIPKGNWVNDYLLDEGFAIRWFLIPLGQSFKNEPVFKMKAVGAEVFSTIDQKVMMSWSTPEKPPVCKKNAAIGEPICTLHGVSLEAKSIAIGPNGNIAAIAIGGLKPRIEIYDTKKSIYIKWQALFSANSGGAVDISFSADGKWVAALLGNGRIHRFKTNTGEGHMSIPSKGRTARSIPPGNTVAVAGKGGEVTLWRLDDGTIQWRLPPRNLRGPVDKIASSGDGRRIATLEYDLDKTLVRIWEINKRSMLAQIEVDSYNISDIALNDDGTMLFVAHEKKGLLYTTVQKKGSNLESVKNKSAISCKGTLNWISGNDSLACSVQRGILQFSQKGKLLSKLSTNIESNDFLIAVAKESGTIAAVGGGHFLLWR